MEDGWLIEEVDKNGRVIWECVMRQRPTNMSWYKDLPSKTHTLRITPLEKNTAKEELYTDIKSLKDATKRLIEANNGL